MRSRRLSGLVCGYVRQPAVWSVGVETVRLVTGPVMHVGSVNTGPVAAQAVTSILVARYHMPGR